MSNIICGATINVVNFTIIGWWLLLMCVDEFVQYRVTINNQQKYYVFICDLLTIIDYNWIIN